MTGKLLDEWALKKFVVEAMERKRERNRYKPIFSVEDVWQLIESLPGVEKVGKWIVQDNTYTRFKCSACGTENHSTRWPFCCQCGAKMEGEYV
jgi:hypothetical protein